MSNEPVIRESKVLEEVREWRKKTHDEWARLTQEDRRKRETALAEEFGLTIVPSRTEQKNPRSRPSDHAA